MTTETTGTAAMESRINKAMAPKAKKVAKKTSTKASTNDKPKDGIRKPQYRVLKALKGSKPLTRNQIAEKAPVDVAMCTEYLGSSDPAVRKNNDTRYFKSLITLGLVREEEHTDKDGHIQTRYSITAKGTAEAAKAPKS